MAHHGCSRPKESTAVRIELYVTVAMLAGLIGRSSSSERSDAGPDAEVVDLEPCNALEAPLVPIQLGTVLGAGRDAAGVIYVVDQMPPSDTMRVFVGEQGMLNRVPVIGGGYDDTEGAEHYEVTVDAPEPYIVVVERDAEGTRMGRTFGNTTENDMSTTIDSLPANEHLEIISSDELEDYAVENTPTEVAIDHLARTDDGELFLVARPEIAAGSVNTERVFYGDPAQPLRERELISLQRTGSGTTDLVFELDGQEASVFLEIVATEEGLELGVATLEHDGDTIDLNQLEPSDEGALLARLRFDCFAE
jgi:hypothetical protein